MSKLTYDQIWEKYIEFWNNKKHAQVPNMSLVPNNDSTLLFVNSGMFPLAPYLAGQPHPMGKRLFNVQRCIRTEDLEEVGDTTHHTFFHMIGNWSLGDYFKETQLPQIMEMHVDHLGMDVSRIYVSVFKGDNVAPRDDEAIAIWKEIYAKYGIEAEYTEDPYLVGTDNYRIFGLDKEDNWWQRGDAPGELGGPDSEMYYDMGQTRDPDFTGPIALNDKSGRYVEFANSVFMQFQMSEQHQWEEMKQKNVDFGGGFERLVSILQGKRDNYDTDMFQPIINKIEKLSGRKWKDTELSKQDADAQNFNFRAIADHIRAAVFIIHDEILPGSKDQGYVLRRIIRRMLRKGIDLGIETDFASELGEVVISSYKSIYPSLTEQSARILSTLIEEEQKFRVTLTRGVREVAKYREQGTVMSGEQAFYIYQTFGFPLEMILEELQIVDKEYSSNLITEFKIAEMKHQSASRAGAEQKFTGGLADHTEDVIKLHTAHHLLLKALQTVLGDQVKQRGSNITGERLRIDFNYDTKLTPEQIEQVEDIVNKQIKANLNVFRSTLPNELAEQIPGVQKEFGQKYPELVSVYSIGLEKNPAAEWDDKFDKKEVLAKFDGAFSVEFCGGPHVENTGELGKFRIAKEESSSSGIRRIKAVLN